MAEQHALVSRPMLHWEAVAVTVVLTLALFVTSALGEALLGRGILVAGAAELLVYALGVQLIWRIWGFDTPAAKRSLALQFARPQELAGSLLMGVLLQVPALSLAAIIEYFWPTPKAILVARAEALKPQGYLHAGLLIFVVVLLAPLIEELLFRGVLYRALARRGSSRAALLSCSACFALAHADPHLALPLFAVALTLGYLRIRAGSIWPSVCAHAGFNFLALMMVWTTDGVEPNLASASLIAVGWVLWLLLTAWLFRYLIFDPAAQARRLAEQPE